MSSEVSWPRLTLQQAGVGLIDCDHRTPPAAAEGFPYIAIPQLKDGHVDLNGVRRIAPADYVEWTKKLKPRAHDVIVVRRCNSGDSALVPPGLECAIGQNLVVLRSNGAAIEPRFLRWLVRGPDWWGQVAKFINVGAVFDSLRCRDIPNFELTVPPLADQREIAELLNALDDRITLLRETNATLEATAQALFKSWFVDFDPVRAKQQGLAPAGMDEATAALFPDSFEGSALGPVPRAWSTGKVEDLLELAYGKALKAIDRVAGDVPVYGSGGVTGFHNCALVDSPTVVVGRKGTVGSLYWEDRPCFPIDTVFYVRARVPLTFCFYQLRILGLEGMNTDGAVPGLNRNNVYRLAVVIPPPPVFAAFDDLATNLRSKIFANETQAHTLTTLRDTLLPRLISGQLRLPEALP